MLLLDQQIKKIEFSRETYFLIERFECGEDDFAKRAEDWLKGTPPDECAFKSIEERNTKVWIYIVEDCVVGFGSLGPNKADNQDISFIPMLAVGSNFQGKTNDDKKISDHIIEDLIEEARETGKPLLCLFVSKHNFKAVRLYEKHGFSAYADGLRHNLIRMCKRLS